MDTQLLRYLCVRILEREELTKQCKKKQKQEPVLHQIWAAKQCENTTMNTQLLT